MSLYQLACAVEGFNRAQGGEETPPPPSDSEFDDMLARAGLA